MAKAADTAPPPPRLRGVLLARNTAVNVVGQALPLVVAVFAIPPTVAGLGESRFGILTLAWIILGYFAVFDLGLGPAITKFVAAALGRGEREAVAPLVWTAVVAQLGLGTAGALVLAALAPALVERVFSVPAALVPEATSAFRILAASIPVVLITGSFRGALEAAQRFDLVNAVRVPASCASFLLPLAGLALGLGLPGIVALLVAARAGTLVANAALAVRVFPALARGAPVRRDALRQLLGFGGWVMASSVTIPTLMYLERVLITYFTTVAALTFYTVPYEMLSRVSLLPASLALTLFPAFSFLQAHSPGRIGELMARPVRYILVCMAPPLLFATVFAGPLLTLWLDADFAARSAPTLRILAAVFFLNAIAHVPFAAIQGLGRPDLKVKLDLAEVAVFAALAWILIPRHGIAGAALAKLGVTVMDLVALSWLALRTGRVPLDALASGALARAVALAAGFAILAGVARWPGDSLAGDIAVFAALTAAYAAAAWRLATDGTDRALISGFIARRVGRRAAA